MFVHSVIQQKNDGATWRPQRNGPMQIGLCFLLLFFLFSSLYKNVSGIFTISPVSLDFNGTLDNDEDSFRNCSIDCNLQLHIIYVGSKCLLSNNTAFIIYPLECRPEWRTYSGYTTPVVSSLQPAYTKCAVHTRGSIANCTSKIKHYKNP